MKKQPKNRTKVIDNPDEIIQQALMCPTELMVWLSKIYISAYQRGGKEREVSIEYNFIGAFDFNDEPGER